MNKTNFFNVIVIGGGHAGVEAAMASSRIGCHTLLLTYDVNKIGQMSCNPAIGGIGKGNLVKEIDALGGVMAQAIDQSGIQFRILNSRKGPAVRATRAQADRFFYKKAILQAIETQTNLVVLQQIVEKLILKSNKVIGVITKNGIKFYSDSVVLTTGTFLNSKIYIGKDSSKEVIKGTNIENFSSKSLACYLHNLPLKINRLKTGTPPRILKNSINFSNLEIQHGDYPIPRFSFVENNKYFLRQIPCYITHTNIRTHEIIQKNLNKSPMYNGTIKSVGPRYCPSIEDKVVRFADRNSHRIFLEPEGLNSKEIYPNGISTSLPFDVQIKIIHSINGLEKAYVSRPGYAIEYDFFDPRDLHLTLESKIIKGLFFAGQINGTTGYEEAAAQGIIAGINAGRLSIGKDTWFPRRDQAYIGVLIDDLCNLGTKEPYRMFTSRSEYRLFLREDNADLRLTEIGRKLGLVNDVRWASFCKKRELIENCKKLLKNTFIQPNNKNIDHINSFFKNPITKKISGYELLRRPEINYKELSYLDNFYFLNSDKQVSDQIETQIKYQGYINRQKIEIDRQLRYEYMNLPKDIDYRTVLGLSNEVTSKLNYYKPCSIGQASRIPGVTPVAISILLIWLKKNL